MNKFDLAVTFYDPDYECIDTKRFYGLTMHQVFRVLKGYEEMCGRDNITAKLGIF